MNILLIHQYFLEEDDPGGSRWNEFTRVWTEQGHTVTVLGGMMHYNGKEKNEEYKGKYFVKKQQGAVTVWRCHVSETYNKHFIGRLWGYFSFMFSSLYAGLFKAKGKFDVIIVTSPPLFVGVSGYLISRLRRMPFVFEVRDLWPESAIDTGVLTNKVIIKLAYFVEGFIYKRAKLINVLTPAFYKALRDKKGIPEKKLIQISNAADFSLSEKLLAEFDCDTFRKEHGLDDRFVITYVGAHGVANCLEQLLDAGEALADTNVLFLLIGQGMEKDRLKKLAEERKITNVRFLDAVPKADVFRYILASEMGASVLKRVDTFKTVYSNKTFDYMSCKKPILMAIDGVSRELVEAAGAGVYVEPENTSEYNRIIRTYLNDPARLQREGESGYRFAKENFDREVLAKRYLEDIAKIVWDKPLKKVVKTILFLIFLSFGLFANGQTVGTNKLKLNSRFSLSISTYNHAERIFDGTMIYKLKDKKLTIIRLDMLSNKKQVLESIEIENDIVEQIKNMKLDTLYDFYCNYCIMATSGSEYFVSITNGNSTKNIHLHHYYNGQIEKLVTLINKSVPDKYKLYYVTSDTKQDCKL